MSDKHAHAKHTQSTQHNFNVRQTTRTHDSSPNYAATHTTFNLRADV